MSNPRHKKLQMMSHTDMSSKRSYTRFSVEESRMAFRMETYMVDSRVNMLRPEVQRLPAGRCECFSQSELLSQPALLYQPTSG